VPKDFMQALRAALGRLFRPPAAPPLPVASDGRVSREAVERLVGLPVRDLALYEQALTHRSVLRGQPGRHLASNERLVFLGDAMLGFVVAEYLYASFPEKNEGFLTRLRAKLVNGQALAHYAERRGLGALILMSDNMVQAAGRQNQTILADAFEAVIGALYLEHGLEAARGFIHRAVLQDVDLSDLATRQDNYKSLLLEYVQARGWPQPKYRLAEQAGPSHDRQFTVEVVLKSEAYGTGTAGSKKKAEQKAAREALRRLQAEDATAAG
jgi:ribonuclease-3